MEGTQRGPVARDLRQRNRAQVLRYMLRTRSTTRARIAQECGISVASAANVVGDLLHEGLVSENGFLPSAGGRPTVTLSVAPHAAYAIGVAVGEHGVSLGLFDLQFTTLDRTFARMPMGANEPSQIAAAVLQGIGRMREQHPEIEDRLLGVGLGLPGIVDTDDRDERVLYAQNLGWPPLRLSELFKESGLRVFADNGAKTQTMAEMWFGAARGIRNGLVTLLGGGIGAGVISQGRLLRGATSSAGEWGHTKVSIGGPRCRCGGLGCLEAYVGGEAIGRRWREYGGQFEGTDEETLRELIMRAEGDDPLAQAVIRETLEILGVGIANLVNLFNPERIVIGGWVGLMLANSRLDELHERVRLNSLDRPGRQAELLPSKLGEDSVALGAALLPVESLIEDALQPRGVT